jgi:hypothetical protein
MVSIELIVPVGDVIKTSIASVANSISTGTPGSVKNGKISVNLKINLADQKLQAAIKKIAEEKITKKVFVDNSQVLSTAVTKAVNDLMSNMLGLTEKDIKVLGTSLGTLKSKKDIKSEPFAAYILSKPGAGEVGLPDPMKELNKLSKALLDTIKIRIRVLKSGVKVSCSFDQEKLIRKTPHPDVVDSAPNGVFYSWLSLVTGPSPVQSIKGFSFVTVSDMKRKLRDSKSKLKTVKKQSTVRSNIKLGKSLTRLMSVSRTKAYAGSYAGIMLSNKKKGYRSFAQVAGGENKDYTPSKTFFGFWDIWWSQKKAEFASYIPMIVGAAIKKILKSGR